VYDLTQTAVGRKPKFLDQTRTFMRPRRHTRRTEQACVDWVGRFLLFHGKWHHREFAEKEVVESLSDRPITGKYLLSCGPLFLYQQFLERKLGRLDGALRASKPARLPGRAEL
jgi:hypothetical protein